MIKIYFYKDRIYYFLTNIFLSILHLILLSIIFLVVPITYAKSSVTGLWKTFDILRNERSTLKFYLIDKQLHAVIVKLPSTAKNTVCHECTGNKKDAPHIGL